MNLKWLQERHNDSLILQVTCNVPTTLQYMILIDLSTNVHSPSSSRVWKAGGDVSCVIPSQMRLSLDSFIRGVMPIRPMSARCLATWATTLALQQMLRKRPLSFGPMTVAWAIEKAPVPDG